MDGAGIYKSLEERLHGVAAVARYSATAGLEDWWSDGDSGVPPVLGRLARLNRLVVVWSNDTAAGEPGNPDIAQDLTPLDWALAVALRCAERGQPIEGLRVHVVDLTGHAFEGAWASLWKQQLLAEMPWITLHAPLVLGGPAVARYRRGYSPLTPGGASVAMPSLLVPHEGGLTLAAVGNPMTSALLSESKHALGLLARQWTASLVQGADHHNVNNLVGPAIISSLMGLPEAGTAPALVKAFVTKLSWTGQMPRVPQDWASQTVGAEDVKRTGFDRIRVLAVDDELERGWDALLCRFFSKAPATAELNDKEFRRLDAHEDKAGRIEMFGCTSALPLIKKITHDAKGALAKDALAQRFRSRNLAFNFTDEEAELLILDLRLAARADADVGRQQIRELLDLVRGAELDKPDGLAWRPIPGSDIQLLRNWLSNGGEPDAPTEAAAITLLARILALAAPLTPILLFSSTGRAEVKDKLKPYRNVLTAFSKPRVLQDFAELREAMAAFSTSLAIGLELLARKDRIARCAALAADVQRERDKAGFAAHKPGIEPHIDFYFDESKSHTSRNFRLGSAATVFPSGGEAVKLQQYLKGHAAGGPGLLPVWVKADKARGTVLKKYSKMESEREFKSSVEFLANQIDVSGAQRIAGYWSATRLWRSLEDPGALQTQESQSIDRHLDLMLNFSVQFNFIVLPRYLGLDSGTCSLYFDRRSVPPVPGELDYGNPAQWNANVEAVHRAEAIKLEKAFGYEWDETVHPLEGEQLQRNPGAPPKILVNTYPVSAFYPLVREALVGWETSWHRLQYRTIRGQQLSKRGLKDKEFESRQLLHDIADWVAGADHGAHTLSPLFPVRLDAELDESLQACMLAARSASWGKDVECIRALLSNARVSARTAVFDPVERILIWACADVLRTASGEALHVDLDALFARLAPANADHWSVHPAGKESTEDGLLFEVAQVLNSGSGQYWLLRDSNCVERGIAMAEANPAAAIGRYGFFLTSGDQEIQISKKQPRRPLFKLRSWRY